MVSFKMASSPCRKRPCTRKLLDPSFLSRIIKSSCQFFILSETLKLLSKVLGNWKEIIDDKAIDAVVIGTWPYLHHTIVLAALRAGKHVLTEARLVWPNLSNPPAEDGPQILTEILLEACIPQSSMSAFQENFQKALQCVQTSLRAGLQECLTSADGICITRFTSSFILCAKNWRSLIIMMI